MSSQSSYRTGNATRTHWLSHTSSPSDPGQIYGSTRDMGPPPPLDLPRPMEIDLNNNALNSSRTLPSPSASAPVAWDPSLYSIHTFGDVPYGSPNTTKYQQIPVEGQVRAPQQNPLLQWYEGNDGPWIPKDIVASEQRSQLRHSGNRNPSSHSSQYRQHNSDGGSYPYGVPPSDSGYGTRHSIGNTSVYSGDVTEREQDCHSFVGPSADYQSYQGFNEAMQSHEARTRDWGSCGPSSSPSASSSLICETCQKPVKTQSELKKHDLRHRKPFKCSIQGCPREEGFSTSNDLERHTKSKHASAIPESSSTKKYRCMVTGCKSKEKSWPRLDNFRSHLRRVHVQQLSDEQFDDIIRRGEFWETSTKGTDLDTTSQRIPQEPAQPIDSESLARQENTNWKPPYPEGVDLSHNSSTAKGSIIDNSITESVPLERTSLPEGGQQQQTVKPLEVFHSRGRIHETSVALESVLAQAGQAESAYTKSTSHHAPDTHGKTSKPREVSASDATIAEVVKIVLDVAHISETSSNRGPRQASERNDLPKGKMSPHISWSSYPNPANLASTGVQELINGRALSDSEETSSDSQAEKKALKLQVLKTIRDLGINIPKDPSLSPKVQNQGSVASNKSDNQVVCQQCKKFKGRPCELKKHMKRHTRPYGCTFITCNKTFGSKNDWKRHENSQHFHLETWRCDEKRPDGGACAKVCYRRQTFQEHLKTQHQMSDDDTIKAKLEDCRMGRNCQARFYCGFCVKLVDLKKKGLDAWTERFDHIDNHFMGRNELPRQSILDWIPLNSDKPTGELDGPHTLGGSPPKEPLDLSDDSSLGSSTGGSPESTVAAGGSPANAINLDATNDKPSKKRKHSSDEGDDRASKQARKSSTGTIVYCCQCDSPSNPRLELQCSGCENPHTFCSSCPRERAPLRLEKS